MTKNSQPEKNGVEGTFTLSITEGEQDKRSGEGYKLAGREVIKQQEGMVIQPENGGQISEKKGGKVGWFLNDWGTVCWGLSGLF